MKHKQSPSQKVVSSVSTFLVNRQLAGKPIPSTLDMMLAARRISRQTRDFRLDGKHRGVVVSLFVNAWDTLVAYVMTILITSLKIALFLFFWVVLLKVFVGVRYM